MKRKDMEKLKILLGHWIEHNKEHSKEFQEWAEKAKTSGGMEVHNSIVEAIDKMREVSEYLSKASEKLN